MKKCSKCSELKEYSEFNKRKISSDGYNSHCRLCANSYKPKKGGPKKKYNSAKERRRSWYLNNIDKEKIRKKNWNQTNKDEIRKYNNQYRQNRLKNDELFKVTRSLRNILYKSFKRNGYSKNAKTTSIIGCSFEEFKKHIESLWQPWMNWNNYGNPKDGIFEQNKTWDIDHIIPLSSVKTEEDMTKLNHYTNLQPLCSYMNRWIKKDSILG